VERCTFPLNFSLSLESLFFLLNFPIQQSIMKTSSPYSSNGHSKVSPTIDREGMSTLSAKTGIPTAPTPATLPTEPILFDAAQSPTPSSTATSGVEATPSAVRKGVGKLRDRLLITILPTVVVPLMVASALGYWTTQQREQQTVTQKLQNQSQLMAEASYDLLAEAQQVTGTLAKNPVVIEAARNATQSAKEQNLPQRSTEQLEAQFSQFKLLAPNQRLNDYLRVEAERGSLPELFFTDANGLNVAANVPSSDFVQKDEAWWQQTQASNAFVGQVEIDESTQRFGVDIAHSILDPQTNEFLGVVKAVLPSEQFLTLKTYLEYTGLTASEEIQLIDLTSSQVLETITAEGTVQNDLVGGSTIVEVAKTLKTLNPASPEVSETSLAEQFKLRNVRLLPFSYEDGSPALGIAFAYEGREFEISPVQNTNWVVVASLDSAEIRAAGQDIILLYGVIALLLAGISGGLVFWLSEQLSRPLTGLADAANQVAQGDLDTEAAMEGTLETQALAFNFNNLVRQTRNLLNTQAEAAEKARLLSQLAQAQNMADLELPLNQLLGEIQSVLMCDRVLVYRFNSDRSGHIIGESVETGLPSALGRTIPGGCLSEELIEDYRKGRVVALENLRESPIFTPQDLAILDELRVKSLLVTPIVSSNTVFGWLIAHQCTQARQWNSEDIAYLKDYATQLGVSFGGLVALQNASREAQRQQLFAQVTAIRAQSNEDLQNVYLKSLAGAREFLNTDGIFIYRFDDNWGGTIVAESIRPGSTSTLGQQVTDTYFSESEKGVELYRNGRTYTVNDIYTANMADCHVQLYQRLDIRAIAIVPMVVDGQLFGLFCTYQTSTPRQWHSSEVDFMLQLAGLVGLSLDRVKFLTVSEMARQQAEELAAEQKQQKESLQMQLVNLLSEVEGASRGDLTVRAQLTAGEIGTVADFFNAIVQSLRKIVVQVQDTTNQVTASVSSNESAIQALAEDALKQTEEITTTLNSVELMTRSIQDVAENARQAAEVANSAQTTAQAREAAMDRTVDSILKLRSTVAEATKKVKRLGEASQQISKVVALINEIALKTNLLSVNASIEAARAGEEGQGFAVVAEEVGALSDQSAAATREIEAIVANIQKETSAVVEAMELGTSQVVEGTQQVEEAKHSLEQILEVSQRINHVLSSIANATVSQTQTSEQVSQLMQAITQAAQNTSNSSLQVVQSLKDTMTIAQELQGAIGQFKVDR
jgi:methyl-accepting chemotaxis protein